MTIEINVSSAYGVIIRNSEHETLRRLSEKFTYGEEEIDEDLPASDILDGEIDFEKLDKKYPGLAADISGDIALGSNRSLIVYIEESAVHIDVNEGIRDAWKLPADKVTKKAQKTLAKFCKKYGIADEPGWVTWSNAA